MFPTLSLPSPLFWQAAFYAARNLQQKLFNIVADLASMADADTSDVWRLYRLASDTDSVSPSAAKALTDHAETK